VKIWRLRPNQIKRMSSGLTPAMKKRSTSATPSIVCETVTSATSPCSSKSPPTISELLPKSTSIQDRQLKQSRSIVESVGFSSDHKSKKNRAKSAPPKIVPVEVVSSKEVSSQKKQKEKEHVTKTVSSQKASIGKTSSKKELSVTNEMTDKSLKAMSDKHQSKKEHKAHEKAIDKTKDQNKQSVGEKSKTSRAEKTVTKEPAPAAKTLDIAEAIFGGEGSVEKGVSRTKQCKPAESNARKQHKNNSEKKLDSVHTEGKGTTSVNIPAIIPAVISNLEKSWFAKDVVKPHSTLTDPRLRKAVTAKPTDEHGERHKEGSDARVPSTSSEVKLNTPPEGAAIAPAANKCREPILEVLTVKAIPTKPSIFDKINVPPVPADDSASSASQFLVVAQRVRQETLEMRRKIIAIRSSKPPGDEVPPVVPSAVQETSGDIPSSEPPSDSTPVVPTTEIQTKVSNVVHSLHDYREIKDRHATPSTEVMQSIGVTTPEIQDINRDRRIVVLNEGMDIDIIASDNEFLEEVQQSTSVMVPPEEPSNESNVTSESTRRQFLSLPTRFHWSQRLVLSPESSELRSKVILPTRSIMIVMATSINTSLTLLLTGRMSTTRSNYATIDMRKDTTTGARTVRADLECSISVSASLQALTHRIALTLSISITNERFMLPVYDVDSCTVLYVLGTLVFF